MKILLSTLVLVGLVAMCSAGVRRDPTPPPPTPSPDFECPSLEESYHRHQSDCAKYYHCVHGLAWLQHCDEGLHFNLHTVQCDWPENAGCQHLETKLKVNATKPDPANGVSSVRGSEIIGPAPWYECPEENGAYPHEEDCDYFYDCYNQLAYIGVCTDLMLFDERFQGCNYAEYVDCGDLNRPTNVPSTTARTTTTPRTTTTRRPGEPTEGPPFECPEPEGLFPDPEDCGAFYQCFGGTSWHVLCPFQLVFNIPISQCDYKANVDCGDRPIIGAESAD